MGSMTPFSLTAYHTGILQPSKGHLGLYADQYMSFYTYSHVSIKLKPIFTTKYRVPVLFLHN